MTKVKIKWNYYRMKKYLVRFTTNSGSKDSMRINAFSKEEAEYKAYQQRFNLDIINSIVEI